MYRLVEVADASVVDDVVLFTELPGRDAPEVKGDYIHDELLKT